MTLPTPLNPKLCRCGAKWGQHNRAFDLAMKPACVVCEQPIKGQCEELYYEKGNYCQKCNGQADKLGRIYKTKWKDLFNITT